MTDEPTDLATLVRLAGQLLVETQATRAEVRERRIALEHAQGIVARMLGETRP